MRITKLPHAHLSIEKGGRRVVVDPGIFSSTTDDEVDAIVVTHEHADHWSPTLVTSLLDRNPDAIILGPPTVAMAADSLRITVVEPGDVVEVGTFTLAFAGGEHAHIHPSFPAMANLGVTVDYAVFHPGDSYTVPSTPVQLAAVPIGGPWHKLEESIDWLSEFTPPQLINLHDAFLSEPGRKMAGTLLADACSRWGGRFVSLEPGQSIDLDVVTGDSSAPSKADR